MTEDHTNHIQAYHRCCLILHQASMHSVRELIFPCLISNLLLRNKQSRVLGSWRLLRRIASIFLVKFLWQQVHCIYCDWNEICCWTCYPTFFVHQWIDHCHLYRWYYSWSCIHTHCILFTKLLANCSRTQCNSIWLGSNRTCGRINDHLYWEWYLCFKDREL